MLAWKALWFFAASRVPGSASPTQLDGRLDIPLTVSLKWGPEVRGRNRWGQCLMEIWNWSHGAIAPPPLLRRLKKKSVSQVGHHFLSLIFQTQKAPDINHGALRKDLYQGGKNPPLHSLYPISSSPEININMNAPHSSTPAPPQSSRLRRPTAWTWTSSRSTPTTRRPSS